MRRIFGDVLNPADLDQAFNRCTLVFHLAVRNQSRESIQTSEPYFHVNTLGTIRVMEACRRLGVRCVVYPSTGLVYGIPQQLPVMENHPVAPVSLYAASKLAGEFAVRIYAENFGMACCIARLGNVYGPGASPNSVIGRMLCAVSQGRPIRLWNLTPVRDFIYVEDAVEGLIRLAAISATKAGCLIANLSTGQGVDIRTVADTLTRVAANGRQPIEVEVQKEEESDPVSRLVLDNTLLREVTGWEPQIPLQTGLRLTLRNLLGYSIKGKRIHAGEA